MFYLYGKSIQDCRWEFVTSGELSDIQRYSDENRTDYVSFFVSETELAL